MSGLTSMAMRTTGPVLEILDQRLLPQEEIWLPINNVDEMIFAIKSLAIRGAPAIGIGAVLALAQSAKHGTALEKLHLESKKLRESRPTAVNLMNCLDRIDEVLKNGFSSEEVQRMARELFLEDVTLCDRMALNGAKVFEDGDTILTHCNTGGLATAGKGTAFGVILEAFQSGKKLHVFVDETRPLLQGARLTAWECKRRGIPYTLITDNMAAHEMAQGKIKKVIVGSDRIARNGDFANKIGTYGLAVLAHYHRIPFYVAAPCTTIDAACESGKEIPIEQRTPSEVRGAHGSFGSVTWAPADAPVDNPSFDVTPAELVTGWILDTGLFHQADVKAGRHLQGVSKNNGGKK